LIVVDTNIVVDISSNQPEWRDWSAERLAAALETGPAIINDVIFAELCAGSNQCRVG
jgi:hypothetical protein